MEGRVALVTGGSRGIGKAIALRFAKAKTHVFINFFQNRTGAEKTAEEAVSYGAQVHLLQADLKDEAQIQGIFKQIHSLYGRLDVLIHNAASGVLRSIVDMKPKHWDWVMDTNARSLLLCAREAASLMR
ncbi:MAG: SDR family NAD(P)-dependent oxidoreductase, partial [Candidatus Binatia bacterium]